MKDVSNSEGLYADPEFRKLWTDAVSFTARDVWLKLKLNPCKPECGCLLYSDPAFSIDQMCSGIQKSSLTKHGP